MNGRQEIILATRRAGRSRRRQSFPQREHDKLRVSHDWDDNFNHLVIVVTTSAGKGMNDASVQLDIYNLIAAAFVLASGP